VQNVRYIDNSLGRLTKWYNSYLRKEPHIVLKRDNVNKSRLEEWEIRSSYKSNLPLEYFWSYEGLTTIIDGGGWNRGEAMWIGWGLRGRGMGQRLKQ
jgi:hypothetical protein